MSKTHVAVLMGGMSSEHDISIKSGTKVLENLSAETFEITKVTISREGLWRVGEEPAEPIQRALDRILEIGVDCAFLALHGPFGEDGRLQETLDLVGLPYTGSGCIASGLAIDKIRCKALVAQAGIPVARQVVVDQSAWRADAAAVTRRVEAEIGLPCVVKSPCQGSSLGMSIPQTAAAFREAVPPLFDLDREVMVEAFLQGTEVTCGVLDVDEAPRALPVTEIRPVTAEFFDYEAKYTPGATQEITPAPISEAETRRVQEVALRVHAVVGCRGLSRSDMILVDGEPLWLEVNTIPGMTETSLFPQAAAAVGITFPALLEKLIQGALQNRK